MAENPGFPRLLQGTIGNFPAKLLQLCPTLCNPIDGSPPGSAIRGILQARTLECLGKIQIPGLDFLPAMQETPVRFLGWEDPLGKDRLPTAVFLGFSGGSVGPWDFSGQGTGVDCHFLLQGTISPNGHHQALANTSIR